MVFNKLRVRGYRSIEDSGELPLGPITVVVGRNNTGKSALLRAIYLLQENSPFRVEDVRFEHDATVVSLWIEGNVDMPNAAGIAIEVSDYIETTRRGNRSEITSPNNNSGLHLWLSREPYNLIYPVLSTRRVHRATEEQIRAEQVRTVQPDDGNIVARLSDLLNSSLPEAKKFAEYCRSILNVELNLIPGQNGQSIGVRVDRLRSIGLDSMGTGISTALNLLISMAWARGKVFLIEEPETDLHPHALKLLLDAIIASSKENQFIISTHSNIVVTRLGGDSNTVVLRTTSDGNLPPTSSFEVATGPDARIDILQELGYELADLDLGEGWIFFEESSAERLTRQFLIPWFAPGLRKLRTLAATGASRLEPLAKDFSEMFVFAHLEKLYRHRAWVIADGDRAGLDAVASLKASFPGWPEDHFLNWSEDNFERYYPHYFAVEVKLVLDEKNRKTKRAMKKDLLNKVIDWILEDEELAKGEFEASASSPIEQLRAIEKSFNKALAG